jgi:hypothetical protein
MDLTDRWGSRRSQWEESASATGSSLFFDDSAMGKRAAASLQGLKMAPESGWNAATPAVRPPPHEKQSACVLWRAHSC